MWPFKKKARADSEEATVVSLLSPAEVRELGGIPGGAVAGVFAGGVRTPEAFRANRVFVDFLHDVIRKAGPSDPSMIAAARQSGDGWFYVIDLRTPDGPQGRVPPEDILGAFEVRSGVVVPGSYQPAESHRVFTKHGLVQLPPALREAFVSELRRRKRNGSERAESELPPTPG